MAYRIIIVFIYLAILSCSEPFGIIDKNHNATIDEECIAYKIDSSLIVQDGNIQYLIAGPTNHEKFNISDSDIDLCKLNQGLGREYFPALYEPQYDPIEKFSYDDGMECIVVNDGKIKKIFPYCVLSQHETINETVNGEAVMVVYCELAKLAAVYKRTYCDKTLTFAPSGYTYFDNDYWNGVQGILMWDRESESLWWPLNDKCLSGSMQGTTIAKASFQVWEYMTWGEIKKQYPHSISVSHEQEIEIPTNLPSYSLEDISCP
jgi:hypothetical protein